MPCLAIHLAVAKKYLEKHSDENIDEFILGTIAPDINMPNINNYINGVNEDKNSHHFGSNYNTTNIVEYMKKKVDFNLFFQSNDINTSFLRAYFLHLLCDYKFFGEYINDERISHLELMDAIKIGYNDYNLITPKIIAKYNINIPEQIKNIAFNSGQGEIQFLDEITVDRFIEEMSCLDLNEEKNKILNKIL